MRRTSSIVLLGAFNPLIFHPLWFADQGLIGKDEASRASANADGKKGVRLIHPDAASWELDWLRFNVTHERCAFTVISEPFEKVFDLVIGCFTVLSHTPLRVVGMNLETVFSAASLERYHAIGDALAPKAPWKALLGEFDTEKRSGGLREMTMENAPRTDGFEGYTRVKVAPAPVMTEFEIMIEVNDHYTAERVVEKRVESPRNAEDVINIIKSNWVISQTRSQRIIESLQGLAS